MTGSKHSAVRLTLLLSAGLVGCTPTPPPVPIAVPQAPDIVRETEATGDDAVRSTIVGGEAPVPRVPSLSPPSDRGGDIAVNFPGSDVRAVAKAVLGDILRVPYSVQPDVNGQVVLVTPGPVARATLLELFEKSLRAAGLALVGSGGGFVIQPLAQAQQSGPVAANTIGYGTELIELQFINAGELKKLLDSVLPGVVQSIESGRNAITIAGTTGQRRSARTIISQFDVNWLRNVSFGLFIPQRTDSRLIVPELNKLINAPDSPTRDLVRLITMEKLNGILAITPQRQYLDDVRRWIEILDREGESTKPRLYVYRVQNGRARDLARTISNAYGSSGGSSGLGSPEGQDPFASTNGTGEPDAGTGPNGPIGGNGRIAGARPLDPAAPAAGQPPATPGFRITVDDANNAVIVFGTPEEFAVVEQAMRELDILPLQVLIEAAITEVSLTDDLRFGVQWNFVTGDSNFTLGEGTTANPTRNLPGFSYFLSTDDISASLNALERRTNIKVVSAPKLLVLNNQTASLQVGDQVPILTQSSVGVQDPNSPIVNSIQYRDTGVILKVTPRVNASGLVLLDIAQEVSDVNSNQGSNIDSPTIATRRVATSIAVQDGQVIALGGLFRDSKSFGKNGLPILSRIPVLGSLLFGNTNDIQRRTELIVLLKPKVVRSVEDGAALTEELRAKLRTLEPFRTQGKIP